MKFLVISQYYWPEPFRISDICEELANRGHNVTVVTSVPNYPDGKIYVDYINKYYEEIINDVKVIRVKIHQRKQGKMHLFLNYLSFFMSANKIIKKIDSDFDYVYCYQLSPIFSCIPGIKYKKRNKIPMVLYCLDVWPEALTGSVINKGVIYKIVGHISEKIYKQSDLLLVTSPSFKDYFIKKLHMSPNNIEVLFQHSEDLCAAYNKNIASKEIQFYFIGNVGFSQNVEDIILAFSKIKEGVNAHLNIVGTGSHFSQCVDLVKKYGLEDTVTFLGRFPRESMKDFYADADVCIVSLKDDGITGYTIPGKLQEYMAAGKPILGFISGDASEIISKANCGICVDPNDIFALANAIEYMTTNYDDLSIYGANAKSFYDNNFSLKKHVDALIEMINGINNV